MVAPMALSPSAMARRAFWSRLYAGRRLGTERAHGAGAAALRARRRDGAAIAPTAFSIPISSASPQASVRDAAGLMERYLARDEPGAPSPSAEFDHAWYASQNPDWSRTHPHPFLHFLETGLRAGRRPRADIDMAFVRDVIRGRGKSIEEAALRVFDPKPRDGDLKPPLSREELKARQDRFYSDASMRIEREPKDRGRKLLVYVQSRQGLRRRLSRLSRATMTSSSTITRTASPTRVRTRSYSRRAPRQPRSAACSLSARISFFATKPRSFSTTTSRSAPGKSTSCFARWPQKGSISRNRR